MLRLAQGADACALPRGADVTVGVFVGSRGPQSMTRRLVLRLRRHLRSGHLSWDDDSPAKARASASVVIRK